MDNETTGATLPGMQLRHEIDLMPLFANMDFCLGNFFYHLAKTLTDDEEKKKEEVKLAKEFLHRFNELPCKEHFYIEDNWLLLRPSDMCAFFYLLSQFDFLERSFSDGESSLTITMDFEELALLEEDLEYFVLENGYPEFVKEELSMAKQMEEERARIEAGIHQDLVNNHLA